MQNKVTPPPGKSANPEADAAKKATRRRIYVNMRIEELRAELGRLTEERKSFKDAKAKKE